jgi:hypothetical protein
MDSIQASATAGEKLTEQEIGQVTHCFARLGVTVSLTGALSVGDKIHVRTQH